MGIGWAGISILDYEKYTDNRRVWRQNNTCKYNIAKVLGLANRWAFSRLWPQFSVVAHWALPQPYSLASMHVQPPLGTLQSLVL